MDEQPVPDVTDEDVTRIALRDFGTAEFPFVLSILEEFGKQGWSQPSARIRLAILKLAEGDLDQLLNETEIAIHDYRDVLSAAEYPRYSLKVGFMNVSEDLTRDIVEDDWREYREWLER